MNFGKVIRQLKETQVLMAEIQRCQVEGQKNRANHVVSMQESMRVHEQHMAHIDMRQASITKKLGFMGGYFKGTQ